MAHPKPNAPSNLSPEPDIGRNDIIRGANKLLSTTSTPAERRSLHATIAQLLILGGQYRGYNFVHWSCEGGFEEWVATGKPKNKEPFLGDQSRTFFY